MKIDNFEINLTKNSIVIEGVDFKLLGNSDRFSQANEMIYGDLGYVIVFFLVKESLEDCQNEAYSLIVDNVEDFEDVGGNLFNVSEHTKEEIYQAMYAAAEHLPNLTLNEVDLKGLNKEEIKEIIEKSYSFDKIAEIMEEIFEVTYD